MRRVGRPFAAEMFASEYASSTRLSSPGALCRALHGSPGWPQMLNIHIVLLVPVLLFFPDDASLVAAGSLVLWLVGASARRF